MSTPPVGYFQIYQGDSEKYEIRKNHIISQTYIANFNANKSKIIVNLPWQFRLAKVINIYLDNGNDNAELEHRIKTETKPRYLFINGTKVENNNVLDIVWPDILANQTDNAEVNNSATSNTQHSN